MSKPMLAVLLLAASMILPVRHASAATPAAAPTATAPQVVLHTSQGDITLELYADKAPKSVTNFLQYTREGFYSGTVLHRAIPGYLVQGGLYTRDLQPKRTHAAIASEADNGLSNLRGTVAVARGADPNSGTAQFFFNLVDNRRLDFVGSQSGLTWGYAVFGKVVKGMDVVDKIAALPTRGLGPFAGDVPNPLVVIDSANVVGEQPVMPPAPASTGKPAEVAPVAPPAKKKGKAKSQSASA